MADFPDVPDVPGVPAVLRDAADAVVDVALLVADVLGVFSFDDANQWGLFLDGEPVVIADSVIAFGQRSDSSIPDYLIEKGGFESFNKVQRPQDIRLRFSSGGNTAARQALLDSIDAAQKSLALYDAVTPQAVYTNINVKSYDYLQRATNGLGLMQVDVQCQEVRPASSADFTNGVASTNDAGGQSSGSTSASTNGVGQVTSAPLAPLTNTVSPSATAQVNDGTVQARAPTPVESSAIVGLE